MTITTAFPTTKSAVGKAILLIITSGPRTQQQLFTEVDFGTPGTKQEKIRQAIDVGWIFETPAGAIDVSAAVRRHFADQTPKEKYIGKITPAPSWNVYERPALSKKHIPDRRGMRRDVPAWSVKPDGYSIKSAGGGDA